MIITSATFAILHARPSVSAFVLRKLLPAPQFLKLYPMLYVKWQRIFQAAPYALCKMIKNVFSFNMRGL